MMIRHIHGGNAGKGVLDFSVSVNPFKPHETTNGSWNGLKQELFSYPEPFCEGLKSSLAKRLGVSDENLLVGNGSIDLIYLIARALHSGKAIVVQPTFAEYEYALKLVGTKIVSFFMKEKNNFILDVDSLSSKIPENGLVFICNPNNPTGIAIERKKLLQIAAVCRKKKAILAVDEAFIEFVNSSKKFSLFYDASKNPNILVLRSLTKTYCVPGIRMGYLIGYKGLIEKIAEHQMPWAVNSIAQALTKAFLNDGKYLRKSLREVSLERQRLYSSLSKIKGLTPYESSANFIMCRINSGQLTSAELKERLLNPKFCNRCPEPTGGHCTKECKQNLGLPRKTGHISNEIWPCGPSGRFCNSKIWVKKRILIRDLSNIKGLGRRYFRVAVKMKKENDILIDGIKGAIRER